MRRTWNRLFLFFFNFIITRQFFFVMIEKKGVIIFELKKTKQFLAFGRKNIWSFEEKSRGKELKGRSFENMEKNMVCIFSLVLITNKQSIKTFSKRKIWEILETYLIPKAATETYCWNICSTFLETAYLFIDIQKIASWKIYNLTSVAKKLSLENRYLFGEHRNIAPGKMLSVRWTHEVSWKTPE